MANIRIKSIQLKRGPGIDPAWLRQQVERELRSIGGDAARELERPVQQWNNKPTMERKLERSTNRMSMIVRPIGPNANKYQFIDFGVKPHIIHAKPGKRMVFQPGYHASTIPNRLMSRRAFRFGKVVSATHVTHHITARNFSDQVLKITGPRFQRNIGAILKTGVERGTRLS